MPFNFNIIGLNMIKLFQQSKKITNKNSLILIKIYTKLKFYIKYITIQSPIPYI